MTVDAKPAPAQAGSGHVITFASIKGGVGKTTGLLALASDLAMSGARAAILDADPNGHASRIGGKIAKKLTGGALSIVGGLTEKTILREIKTARAAADFVLVDLPGVASQLTLLGLARSDLVVIPLQASDMDISDALVTVEHATQASEAAERDIRVCFLLSRWPVTIETRAAKETRRRLAKKAPGVPVLETPMMERTVLKEMTFNGQPPALIEPDGNAAANVAAVRAELLSLLGRSVEVAS